MAIIENHPRKIAAGAGAGGLAAGIALAVTVLIPQFEGERHKAYLDPVGVATICFGTIEGVKLGDTASHGECLNLLSADVQKRVPAMQKCLNVPVSPKTAAAMISFGYNVGTGAFCKGVAPLANAGRLHAACDQMSRYHYAGGKSLPGLVRRRAAEHALCVEGLS